jgi:hypothetical protein
MREISAAIITAAGAILIAGGAISTKFDREAALLFGFVEGPIGLITWVTLMCRKTP